MSRPLVATLLLFSAACASTRPAGSGQLPLTVDPHGSGWDSKLGAEPIGHAEHFRAAGFDAVADDLDSHRSYAWGGLALGTGMAGAAVGCGYGFGQTHNAGFMVGAILTGTWAITALIISATHFGSAGPSADQARAAADSYNDRLKLTAAQVAFKPPEPGDAPGTRAADDRWLLGFATSHGLDQARAGIVGLRDRNRVLRLGLQTPALVHQVDAAFAAAGDDALSERTRFALDLGDREVRAATRAALERRAPEARDPMLWIDLGDLGRAQTDPPRALSAYREALQLAPLSMPALRACGMELRRQGHGADAVALWSAAVPRVADDNQRFELLDSINATDHAWIYAHAAQLPPGLPQAYADHVEERRRQERLSRCLSACYDLQWESLRRACEADCYAAVGP
jgi:hypothetical protein